MTVTIKSGWLHGSLPDDTGREWPILRFPESSARGPLAGGTPNLVLHTTETYNPVISDDGYVEDLRYPSQWQCGNGIIGQHIRLGLAGDALNTWDLYAQQIEMVADSQLGLWLPAEDTLGPTVALTAWLHRTGRIKTGVRRPIEAWPTVLDHGPQATLTYYRRHAGLWPDAPGVYGHVDVPNNEHWDPGSFNYPVFVRRVAAAIAVQEGDDMAVLTELEQKQIRNFMNELSEQLGTATARGTARRVATAVVSTEKDEEPTDGLTVADADARYAQKDHPHAAETSVR